MATDDIMRRIREIQQQNQTKEDTQNQSQVNQTEGQIRPFELTDAPVKRQQAEGSSATEQTVNQQTTFGGTGVASVQEQPDVPSEPQHEVNRLQETASKEPRVAAPPADVNSVEVKPKEGESEGEAALQEATIILKRYGGLEGNIPVSSPYWGLMNTYRAEQSDRRR